ncbi:hypothetical protein D3C72_1340990 [compost metagenome]
MVRAAEQRGRRQFDVVEANVRRAAPVVELIGTQADTGRLARHIEQRQPAFRQASRNKQMLRLGGAHHQPVDAVQAPVRAIPARNGFRMVDVAAGLALAISQRAAGLAAGQRCEQRFASFCVLRAKQHLRAEDRAPEHGLHHQGLAERFQQWHEVGQGAAQAAVALRDQQAGQAQLGKGSPCGRVEAVPGSHGLAPALEAVVLVQPAAQGAVHDRLLLVHLVLAGAVDLGQSAEHSLGNDLALYLRRAPGQRDATVAPVVQRKILGMARR